MKGKRREEEEEICVWWSIEWLRKSVGVTNALLLGPPPKS